MISTPLKLTAPGSGQKIDFCTDFDSAAPNFVIASIGRDGAGKSRLAVTGPRRTFILPTDRKTRNVVEMVARELGRKMGEDILMPTEAMLPSLTPAERSTLTEQKSMEFGRKYVNAATDCVYAAYAQPDVKVIAIDQAPQLYKGMLMAHYGEVGHKVKKIGDKMYKDHSLADEEYERFIQSISKKIVILTNRAKDEYVGNIRTGRQTWENPKFLGNMVDVVVEQERNLIRNSANPDDLNWRYGLNINTCNLVSYLQGPDGHHSQTGMRDENINLRSLLDLVFPGLDSSQFDWGDGKKAKGKKKASVVYAPAAEDEDDDLFG